MPFKPGNGFFLESPCNVTDVGRVLLVSFGKTNLSTSFLNTFAEDDKRLPSSPLTATLLFLFELLCAGFFCEITVKYAKNNVYNVAGKIISLSGNGEKALIRQTIIGCNNNDPFYRKVFLWRKMYAPGRVEKRLCMFRNAFLIEQLISDEISANVFYGLKLTYFSTLGLFT